MSGLIFGGAKPVSQTAPSVSSFDPQTSCYGKPIPLLWGRNRLAPNLIWYSDFIATPHESSSSAGGKGGGDQQSGSVNYTYTVACLLGLCEGPVGGFGNIWQQRAAPQALADLGLTGFTGSYTQDEFGWLLSAHPESALKYRGLAYVATAAYDLGESGTLPNNNIEVQGPFAFGASATKNFTVGITNYILNSAQAGPTLVPYTALIFATSGTLPAPLSPGVTYYVTNPPNSDGSLTTFNVSATPDVIAGAITITNAGTGTHYISNYLAAADLEYGDTYFDLIGVGNYDLSATPLIDQVLTSAAHGFTANQVLHVSSSGTLPGGLAANQDYYVVNPTTNTLQLSPQLGGAPVALTSTGTGTHSMFPYMPDANPADIIPDYLSNVNYGCGFPLAKIGDLTAFSNYCVAAGIFLSPVLTDQEPGNGLLQRLVMAGYSEIVWSEDQLKIIPYYEQSITGNGVTFTPDVTADYALTDDDFQPSSGEDPVQVDRVDPADAYNAVIVEYCERLYQYNTRPIEVRNEAAIALYGYRPAPTIVLHEAASGPVAMTVARNALDHFQNIRNAYRFRLPARFALIEPMDIETLTESTGDGLSAQPVRIKEMEEDENGYLIFTGQDIRANAVTDVVYDTEPASGYASDFNATPGDPTSVVIFDAPAQLTPDTLEVWCGLAGGANWGGAEVWVSWDQTTYARVGTFAGESRCGRVKTALARAADPDVTNSFDVNLAGGSLASGTQADCDDFRTLCWVGGELISYQTATLVSGSRYTLGGRLRRGVYGTPIKKTHAVGEGFVRLDLASGSVFRFAYDDPTRIGKTAYLKFLSFNTHGAAQQQLAEVRAYRFKIRGPIGVPPLATPQGLEIFNSATGNSFSGRHCKFVWRQDAALNWYELGSEPIGNNQAGSGPGGAGGLDSFFKDYLVEVYDVDGSGAITTLLRREHVIPAYYTYTWEKNAEDHAGAPVRTFAIKVYQRSVRGGLSVRPAVMVVANPAPALTSLTLTAIAGGFKFAFTASTDTDFSGVKFYASETSGYALSEDTLVHNMAYSAGQPCRGQVHGLADGLTHYVRAVPYDIFGDGVEYG